MARRLLGGAATTLLVVAALSLAGWFAYSFATGATLVTFRTGSMAPTMPQGAVAVTVPVSASELEVGDVITVQRVNESMPVTHRIIEIEARPVIDPKGADLRAFAPGTEPTHDPSASPLLITMQGDDNDAPDHLPYLLTDAQKVMFAIPMLGTTVMLLQSPIGMGILVLGAAALTTWAFWPRRVDQPEKVKVQR